jgi:hypothetical protein
VNVHTPVLIFMLVPAVLAGCGGTKVLREARPLEQTSALLAQSDGRVHVSLDSVVVRNGPGSWARDANWDEYRFRVRSATGGGVRLTGVHLLDAVGHRVAASSDRGDLVDATREVERRYEISGQLARSPGGWTYVAGGVATAAVGTAVAAGAMYGAALSGGAVAGGAVAAANLLVGGGLILIGAGAVRVVNNVQVGMELRERQTALPLMVGASESRVNLFFPITPLPKAMDITYTEGGVEHRMQMHAGAALAELHLARAPLLEWRPDPRFPAAAERAGIQEGFVKALLTIDEDGNVGSVHILTTSSRYLLPEAREAFGAFKYNKGWDGRTSEEVLRFRREGAVTSQ